MIQFAGTAAISYNYLNDAKVKNVPSLDQATRDIQAKAGTELPSSAELSLRYNTYSLTYRTVVDLSCKVDVAGSPQTLEKTIELPLFVRAGRNYQRIWEYALEEAKKYIAEYEKTKKVKVK